MICVTACIYVTFVNKYVNGDDPIVLKRKNVSRRSGDDMEPIGAEGASLRRHQSSQLRKESLQHSSRITEVSNIFDFSEYARDENSGEEGEVDRDDFLVGRKRARRLLFNSGKDIERRHATVGEEPNDYGNFYPRDELLVDDFRFESKKFCGSFIESASLCEHGCPFGLDSECPHGQSCFDVDQCVKEDAYPSLVGSGAMYCISTINSVSHCVHRCPSGLDNECPFGQKCHYVENCNNFCGSTFGDASQCSLSCYSGFDDECPIGQKCYTVDSCIPTAAPTARPRFIVEVVYTFCIEHVIYSSVYQVLRYTDKAVAKLMTQKFLESSWDVNETYLRVESVSTVWRKESPSFQCKSTIHNLSLVLFSIHIFHRFSFLLSHTGTCNIEDTNQSRCTGVESTVQISFWEDLNWDPGLIRYILLNYQEYISKRMKYRTTYQGCIPFESSHQIKLRGVKSTKSTMEMTKDTQKIFERIIKKYLNNALMSYRIPGLEVLVTKVASMSIVHDLRAVSGNKRRLDGVYRIVIEIDTVVNGKYIPPSKVDVDVGELIEESIQLGASNITQELKDSGAPYFKNLIVSDDNINDVSGGDVTEPNIGLILGILCLILSPTILIIGCCFLCWKRETQVTDLGNLITNGYQATHDHDLDEDGDWNDHQDIHTSVPSIPEAHPLYELDPSEENGILHATHVVVMS